MILVSSWWVIVLEVVGVFIFVLEEYFIDENRVVDALNDWRMDKEIK